MLTELLTKNDLNEVIQKLDEIASCLKTQSNLSLSIYTNNQLSALLGVSKKTLEGWRNGGKIGFTKLGRKIFYTQEHLITFLNKYSFIPFK
jgi:hypothetical protein